MDDTAAPPAPKKRKSPSATTSTSAGLRTTAPRKGATKDIAMTDTLTPNASTTANPNRTEAKTRFNAALDEAKAGAAALKAEGRDRAAVYRDQAKTKSDDWVSEAKTYAADAKVKGKDLATEGKVKASEGLRSLGSVVADNAHVVDEKLGAKYGDYARSASRSLAESADKLDQKSIDDLGQDAREFVRRSPGTAVGIAALAGFFLSRLFRRSR